MKPKEDAPAKFTSAAAQPRLIDESGLLPSKEPDTGRAGRRTPGGEESAHPTKAND